MATITGSQADLDSKIKETKRWLKKQKKQIKDLKGLLETAKQEFSRLKDELTGYEAARTPGPINICPSEILSIIFKLTIHDNPTHIRRLLLVCRRWYNTGIQDPRLWSIIHLTVPYNHWDVRSWVNSIRPYVRSCLAHSSSVPLDIDLNLVHLWSKQEQIRQSLRSGLDKDLGILWPPECFTLEDWFIHVDVKTLEKARAVTRDCTPRHVFDLIQELIGPEGTCLARWKNVRLALPSDDEMATEIWNMISQPLPNISRIHLSNLNFPSHVYQPSGHRYAPRVQRLTMSELNDWGFFAFLPTTICELSVESNLDDQFLHQISRLKGLRSLTVLDAPSRVYTWIWDLANPPVVNPNPRLSLPFLQDLIFVGWTYRLEKMEFLLPALLRLVLGWRCDEFRMRRLPIIQPKFVRWSFVMNPEGRAPDDLAGASVALQRILLQYTEAEKFTVPIFVKRCLLRVLRKLSRDGSLPVCWKAVSFHDDLCEIVEVLAIEEILSQA